MLYGNKTTRFAAALNGGAENAGVENAGAITYGKPSEEKTLRDTSSVC